MSKRLQVILDEDELRAIQEIAKQHHTTVAEWVRQALRAARRKEPRVDAERKLKAVRAAVCHQFPAGDIQQMLAEIESGYLQDDR
jgi:SOS response regulatory protein OraA/RecX